MAVKTSKMVRLVKALSSMGVIPVRRMAVKTSKMVKMARMVKTLSSMGVIPSKMAIPGLEVVMVLLDVSVSV